MRPLDIRTPRSSRCGFTLVEIMAATGIMLVVILLVLSLTTNVLSSWTRSTGQLQTNFEARVAMDLLTSDLESMVVRNRNICWMQVEDNNLSVNEATVPSQILYFFAPTLERPREKGTSNPKQPILGDVCAISYRQDFKNPFTGNTTGGTPPPPVFGLYRTVIDSENTFNEALAIKEYDSDESNNTLSEYWSGNAYDSDDGGLDTNTIDEAGGTIDFVSEDWITDASNFLSQNVAQFRLVFWVDDGSTTPKALVNNDGTPKEFIYAGSGLYYDGSIQPGEKLIYVDVSLTILDKEGAAALNQGTAYAEVLKEYGQVFNRRINLMSSPL